VLDFGSSGVGDPACDMVIAWTFLHGRSRDRFRAELGVDRGTWSRGRGWALWKALITLAKDRTDADRAARRMGWRDGARNVIAAILADDSR
jgi:aminoglycoside phosphotransferase (APT) family kinase protein